MQKVFVKTAKIHFSLHDVCPAHLDRLIQAEALFELWGVTKVTYLVVPFFHNTFWAHEHSEFKNWILKPRSFEVEWCLHGFYHLETISPLHESASWLEIFKRKFMTGGEGEFLSLRGEGLNRQIQEGKYIFLTLLGFSPQGFVPPAWLYNSELDQALIQNDFEWTEDHHGIRFLKNSKSFSAPVITWATRTFFRKWASLLVCPALLMMWRKKELVRIAVHPHDFDHEHTKNNIQRVLAKAFSERTSILIKELL
jgi:predicted deacetylase